MDIERSGRRKSESERVGESVGPRSIVADSEYPGRYRLLMYLSSQYVMFASITHCIIDTGIVSVHINITDSQQADTALYLDPNSWALAQETREFVCSV